MTSPLPVPTLSADDLEGTIRAFSTVLENLETGHAKLAARAERVEAELCRANAELAAKVAELDAVKRHLEAILSSLPTGVVVRDAGGAVVRVNDAALALLGCAADELAARAEWPGLTGAAADGSAREVECADGARRTIANRYSPVRLRGGEVVGSVEILDDRTELEAMARRVHQLDKMAALGTMAGGVAHEIRNPLNAVQGFAGLLARKLPEGSQEARWARLIQEGAGECDAIVSSLLTFASPERLLVEALDARELVDEAAGAVRRELEARGAADRYSITTHVGDVELRGDRIKLRQALRNLLANAVRCQPEGGDVRVDVHARSGAVQVRVTDGGPGIPPELRDRVTEPFFTTRADGTGLGLALVHTIARLHGGTFEVSADPAPLGGADVRLTLPSPSAPDPR